MCKRVAMLLSAAGMVLAVACGRSDPGITTAVKARFAVDETVKAYQIDVDTSSRVVTLSGTVETPAAKEHAVMIARQTDGVRDVIDQLRVDPQATATAGDLADTARETIDRGQLEVGDAAITAAIKTSFLADPAVSGLKIDVDTKDGVVTLTGTAATRAEADSAERLARDSNGVTRVVNNLQVSR